MSYQGGSLKSTSINGVKVYSVAGQNRSTATWLPPKKLRALRKNTDYLQRVDLIQDLRFETATGRIKATPDGEFLIASGIYPPQVKVYELRELSLKLERHLVSEIIDFEVLADDYSKLAFLCADRSVCLHAKYGSHYILRIPRMGRDITYDPWSCDLLCAASSPDLYRINLEQGCFLKSMSTQSPALNVVTRSKLHGLVACGGDDGAVECFDMRVRSSVGRINVVAHAGDIGEEVTALEFDGDGGYHMAVGSSSGKVLIYDLRSSHPMREKDHMYGSPILNIKWHRTPNSETAKLITTDKHIVRIWDPETGEGMTSIEPGTKNINDICIIEGSGLIFLALDSSEIPYSFIPALGPAPKWCSYLENLTEEMEEDAQTTIYDDYKFLTKEDLERLNLTGFIGTNLLRAYMHGFFVNHKLYKKAQAVVNPFAYDSYLEQKKKEKQEEMRASRITMTRKLPKVNRDLAARLEDEEAENEQDGDGTDAKKTSKKKKRVSTADITDERFSKMFEKADYEIRPDSEEYRALHPMSKQQQPNLIKEHLDPLMEDDELNLNDSDESQSEDEDNDDQTKPKKKSRVPRLYEVKDDRHAEAYFNERSLAKEDALPLGERVAAMERQRRAPTKVKFGPGGSREITFVSRSKAKYQEDEDEREEAREKRRGVQSLGFKPDRSGGGGGFRSRGRGGGSRGGRGRGGGGRGGGRGRGRGRR